MNHRELRYQRNEREFQAGDISRFQYELVKRNIEEGVFDKAQSQSPWTVHQQARQSLLLLRWSSGGIGYLFRSHVHRPSHEKSGGLLPFNLSGVTSGRLYKLAVRTNKMKAPDPKKVFKEGAGQHVRALFALNMALSKEGLPFYWRGGKSFNEDYRMFPAPRYLFRPFPPFGILEGIFLSYKPESPEQKDVCYWVSTGKIEVVSPVKA